MTYRVKLHRQSIYMERLPPFPTTQHEHSEKVLLTTKLSNQNLNRITTGEKFHKLKFVQNERK